MQRCMIPAGETPALVLDKAAHNDFERGKTDTFNVKALDVGELRFLKVGLAGVTA